MNVRPRREGAARTRGGAAEPILVGAVDVGATKTLVTVRTLPVATWEPGGALRLQTTHDPEAALDVITAALVRLSGGRPLGAVGVGVPGPLDPASGVIAHSPNLGWREIPFGQALTARLGVPVILDDDARSGALGEAVLGAGSGADPVAYLTLSTGIGSGIVVADELVRGAHGFAGEVGHLVIDPAGPPCACGRRGCVESFAGGASLARRARVTWPDGRLADGRPAPLDASGVLRLARAGDVTAMALANDAARALARALAALAAVLDPERIVIGGSLGLGQRALVRRATVLSRRLAIPEAGRTLAVVPAALRGESVLAGAAVLAARAAQAAGTRTPVHLASEARGRH